MVITSRKTFVWDQLRPIEKYWQHVIMRYS